MCRQCGFYEDLSYALFFVTLRRYTIFVLQGTGYFPLGFSLRYSSEAFFLLNFFTPEFSFGEKGCQFNFCVLSSRQTNLRFHAYELMPVSAALRFFRNHTLPSSCLSVCVCPNTPKQGHPLRSPTRDRLSYILAASQPTVTPKGQKNEHFSNPSIHLPQPSCVKIHAVCIASNNPKKEVVVTLILIMLQICRFVSRRAR